MTLCVPPTLLAYCQAAEQGKFPRDHHMRWVKSGAAPLAPELARRFTEGTGIPIRQGYGMTEASPVTHMGFLAPELYRPDSVGAPVAQTECRVVDENENDVAQGEIGELVMRGPQFMLGYWKSPDATAAVLRDGWYWTGDIVRVDEYGLYYVVDRRKEMMKYKGSPSRRPKSRACCSNILWCAIVVWCRGPMPQEKRFHAPSLFCARACRRIRIRPAGCKASWRSA